MEIKELKIEIPEGFEIDKENSSFEKIVFKKKENTKPRSWEEYINNYTINGKEHYIGSNSIVYKMNPDCIGRKFVEARISKNWIPTKELAEAFLAMMQLMSLREAWIGDWKPDCNWNNTKYCLIQSENIIRVCEFHAASRALSFPTSEMATDFMNCFKDLLNVAKPLI